MNIKERREFYKELYFHEIREQKSIEARIGLALAVFGLIFSASFFLVEKILLIVNTGVILDPLSLLTIVFSLSIFVYLCYCVYRGLAGWEYREILSTEIDEYHDKLKQHYGKYRNKYGKQKVELMIQVVFERKLLRQIIEYAGHNHHINRSRAAYLKRYFDALPLYLFALVLLYFLFYIR